MRKALHLCTIRLHVDMLWELSRLRCVQSFKLRLGFGICSSRASSLSLQDHLLEHVQVAEGCDALPHNGHELSQGLEDQPQLRQVLLRPDVWPACPDKADVAYP